MVLHLMKQFITKSTYENVGMRAWMESCLSGMREKTQCFIAVRHKLSALLLLMLTVFSEFSEAAGGKYNDPARILSEEIYSVLISSGLCLDHSDCNKQELIFGDHDRSVCFYFYGVKDHILISKIVEVSAKFSETQRVPVELYFYSDLKRELLGLKKFFSTPRVKVEISI